MTSKRVLPIGSTEVTWRLRYEPPHNPLGPGFPMEDRWPKLTPGCYEHGDDLRPHHGTGYRWQLRVGSSARCERCVIDWLLAGEAVLDRVDEFRTYVEEIEAKGRGADRAGEHPELARLVLDAASSRWGSKTVEPLIRALEVALRHPGRARALQDAMTAALGAAREEAPRPDPPMPAVSAPPAEGATRQLERAGTPIGPMSSEIGRAPRRGK